MFGSSAQDDEFAALMERSRRAREAQAERDKKLEARWRAVQDKRDALDVEKKGLQDEINELVTFPI